LGDKEIKQQLFNELIETQKALEERLKTQEQMIKKFQTLTANEDLLVRIIDYFPYPIAVFSSDGILELVNYALLNEVNVSERETIVNRYNVFYDSSDTAAVLTNAIKRVLAGETVFLFDLKDALKSIAGSNLINGRDISVCRDAILFPITDSEKKVCHVVVVLMNQQQEEKTKEQEL